jgi:hypothetical protein
LKGKFTWSIFKSHLDYWLQQVVLRAGFHFNFFSVSRWQPFIIKVLSQPLK